MKKIIISLIALITLVSLSGCSLSDKTGGEVIIESENISVLENAYNNFCEKYNLENSSNYVIDNYEDYLKICIEINHVDDKIIDKKTGDEYFSKNVKIIKPRIAKDEKTVATITYKYSSQDKNIYGWYYNKSFNKDEHEGKVAYFIDVLDVPRNIYKRMSK